MALSSPSDPFMLKHFARFVVICMLATCAGETVQAQPQSAASLPAGKILWVRFERRLSSKTAQVGDQVRAEVVKPAKLNHKDILPAGTTLLGEVRAVRPSDRPHRIHPLLKIALTEIILPGGRAVPANASLEGSGRIGFRRAYLTGFAFALGGGIIGGLTGALWGKKGEGRGAAIGIPAASVSGALYENFRSTWRNVDLRERRKIAVRLDDELRLPVAPSARR